MKSLIFGFVIFFSTQLVQANCALTGTIENWRSLAERPIAVLKVGAKWCSHCQKLAPVYEEIACANKDVVFVDIDIDEQPGLAKMLQVRQIPYLFFLKNKKLQAKFNPTSSLEIEMQINELK